LFCCPNFLDHYKRFNWIDSNTVEHFFLKESIDLISISGKSIGLISNGALFRPGKEKQLREWLINNDYVESIIQLPGNLLLNTSIPSNIIVLSKNKEMKGFIKMLDATDLIEVKQRSSSRLIVEDVLKIYHSNESSEKLRFVSNEEIDKSEFNLTVSRYLVENLSDKIEGVKLGEIISHVRGEKIKGAINTKYLKIGDLNDHNMGIYADLEGLKEGKIKRNGFQVNKPVILLANRFQNLKPTILEAPGDNLVISNDIKAFEINEEEVEIGYLVFELRKDYIQEQILKYQTGAVMPYISVDDLLNIKIKLPTKKEQRQHLLDEINQRYKNELNKYAKECKSSNQSELISLGIKA
jgi:type I restriction enzyme M protein